MRRLRGSMCTFSPSATAAPITARSLPIWYDPNTNKVRSSLLRCFLHCRKVWGTTSLDSVKGREQATEQRREKQGGLQMPRDFNWDAQTLQHYRRLKSKWHVCGRVPWESLRLVCQWAPNSSYSRKITSRGASTQKRKRRRSSPRRRLWKEANCSERYAPASRLCQLHPLVMGRCAADKHT